MADNSDELARRWLEKTDHDLITARQVLLLPEGPTDIICFHAQQAVEKALKALLTLHRITFPKVHNLVVLLDLAKPLFPDLEPYREEFAQLSAYAVEVRYPDDRFEPPRQEALHSLSLAEEVVGRVRRKLAESKPQTC